MVKKELGNDGIYRRLSMRCDQIHSQGRHYQDGQLPLRRLPAATGASFGNYVFVNEGDLSLVQGTSKSFEHGNELGATMTKRLCGNCGSQHFGKGSRGGGMIHITVGAIDDASFVCPAMDIFVGRSNRVYSL